MSTPDRDSPPDATSSGSYDTRFRPIIDPAAENAFRDRIRFGCGALFGAVLGIAGIGRMVNPSGWLVAGAVAAGAVACGLASMRKGDRFWRTPPLDDGFRWWWF